MIGAYLCFCDNNHSIGSIEKRNPTTKARKSLEEQNRNTEVGGMPDLSGIDPALRDRVRKRLAAIAEFEMSPSRKNAERLARSVGLKTAGFYNLVRAWQTLQDPMDLVGRTRPRSKLVSLNEEARTLVAEVMAKHHTMQIDDLIEVLETRAMSRGVALPPRLRLKRYVIKHRTQSLPDNIAKLGDIIIDHSVANLPVAARETGTPMRPLVTAAIDINRNRVLALALSHGRPSATVMGSVIRSAVGVITRAHAPICLFNPKIVIPEVEGQPQLITALEQSGFVVISQKIGPYDHGKGIEALLGQINSGIRFLPRLVTAPDERRQMRLKPGKTSISLEDAQAMVCHRLNIPAVAPPDAKPASALDEFLDQAGRITGG